MRTLTLKLTAAITGRRTKPAASRAELAALKEQARQLLNDPTPTQADLSDLTPAPVTLAQCPPTVALRPRFGFGPAPQPTYVPEPPRVQAMAKAEPFGTVPTGEKRPAKLPPGRRVSGWDIAWARLTPSEIAWSSQP